MKKLLATITLSTVAACAFGQGTVNIGTGAGANTKFIVTHTGVRIAGTDYLAQLFWANGEGVTDENTLQAAGTPINPRTGAAAGVLPSGEIRLETVTPPGGPVTLQLRAWSSVLGATESAAFAAWQSQAPADTSLYGRSALFTMVTANPLMVPPPTPPSDRCGVSGSDCSPGARAFYDCSWHPWWNGCSGALPPPEIINVNVFSQGRSKERPPFFASADQGV